MKAQYLPPQTASCDLRVVSAAGGEARRVASRGHHAPARLRLGPRGRRPRGARRLRLPRGRRHAVRRARRRRARQGRRRRRRSPGSRRAASAWRPSRAGAFSGRRPGASPAWLAGRGRALLASSSSRATAPAAAGTPAALVAARGSGPGARSSRCALRASRRRASAGAGGRVRVRARRRRHYAFTVQAGNGDELQLARGGRARPCASAAGVHAFAFSPDGGALAFVGEARRPGEQGDLYASVVAERRARCCGREVGEFRWAARRAAARLARAVRPARPRRARSARAGRASRRARSARTSRTSSSRADGAHVAFLQHTTRGGYSVDLALARARRARRARRPRPSRAGRLRLRLLARRAVALLPDPLRAERRGLRPRADPGRRAPPARSARAGRAGGEELRVRPARPGAAPRHLAAHGHGRARRRGLGEAASSSRSTRPCSRARRASSGRTRGGWRTSVAHPKRAGVYVAELPR